MRNMKRDMMFKSEQEWKKNYDNKFPQKRYKRSEENSNEGIGFKLLKKFKSKL